VPYVGGHDCVRAGHGGGTGSARSHYRSPAATLRCRCLSESSNGQHTDSPEERPWSSEGLAFARLQKAAWALALGTVALGFGGAFGGGPLSNAEISDRGLTLGYERFVRRSGEAELTLSLPAAPETERRVAISSAYLDSVRIESITPAPLTVRVLPSAVEFAFAVQREVPARVVFHLRVRRFGSLAAEVSDPSGRQVRLWQFAYP
jgi:hypothetical protein